MNSKKIYIKIKVKNLYKYKYLNILKNSLENLAKFIENLMKIRGKCEWNQKIADQFSPVSKKFSNLT